MSENTIKSNTFYCTICQTPEEALPNVYRVRPYVNEIIIVHNHPVITQVKAEFDELRATLHYVDWKEDFSYKRTQYIRKSGEIIKENSEKGYNKDNTWLLVTDTDEFPGISLLQNLQSVIAKAEINKSTVCTINVHDIFIKGEGTTNPFTFIPRPLEEIDKSEIISQNVGSYHKELLVKYNDRLEYRGKVHHTLSGTGLRNIQAPKDYWYDHIKTDADLHSHGCRNWFIGGGGVQEFGEKWKVLRSITNKYSLDSWEKMEKAMKIGNIHSDILQFFIEHKDDNDSHTDSELRSFYSYYKICHPKELENIVQTVKTIVTKDGIKDAIPVIKKIEDIKVIDSTITSIDTTKPLYNNPQKVTGDYTKDMSYHFQDVKVSSDSSNSSDYFKSSKINDNELIENDDEIREFVEDTYNIILGRAGDPSGVKNYVDAIKSGRVKKEKLADVFRRSDEYLEKGLET